MSKVNIFNIRVGQVKFAESFVRNLRGFIPVDNNQRKVCYKYQNHYKDFYSAYNNAEIWLLKLRKRLNNLEDTQEIQNRLNAEYKSWIDSQVCI